MYLAAWLDVIDIANVANVNTWIVVEHVYLEKKNFLIEVCPFCTSEHPLFRWPLLAEVGTRTCSPPHMRDDE